MPALPSILLWALPPPWRRADRDRIPTGPHHAALRCSVCARHIRFLPAPWTRHRAETFRMPFGVHAGRTLAELAGTESGREYLAWMVMHLEGNPGIAARIVLEQAS